MENFQLEETRGDFFFLKSSTCKVVFQSFSSHALGFSGINLMNDLICFMNHIFLGWAISVNYKNFPLFFTFNFRLLIFPRIFSFWFGHGKFSTFISKLDHPHKKVGRNWNCLHQAKIIITLFDKWTNKTFHKNHFFN